MICFLGRVTSKILSECLEEFENTKGVIRIRKSKKDRQHNGQKKKNKQRSTKHSHKMMRSCNCFTNDILKSKHSQNGCHVLDNLASTTCFWNNLHQVRSVKRMEAK
jgi:hypothetical protein